MAISDKGRWVTINGRKIFIGEGQSLKDAMAKSGKFGSQKETPSEADKKSEQKETIAPKEDKVDKSKLDKAKEQAKKHIKEEPTNSKENKIAELEKKKENAKGIFEKGEIQEEIDMLKDDFKGTKEEYREYISKEQEKRLQEYEKEKEERMNKFKQENNESEDYRMAHRPNETGITADDLTKQGYEGIGMPKDIYEHPEYYSSNNKEWLKETTNQLNKAKNNPDAEITIYRATPGDKINNGDWVTLSKKYAEAHNESQLDGKGNILEMKVKAKDVHFAGDSLEEWGYFPKETTNKLDKAKEQAKRYKKNDKVVYGDNVVEVLHSSNAKDGKYLIRNNGELEWVKAKDLKNPSTKRKYDNDTYVKYGDGVVKILKTSNDATSGKDYYIEGYIEKEGKRDARWVAEKDIKPYNTHDGNPSGSINQQYIKYTGKHGVRLGTAKHETDVGYSMTDEEYRNLPSKQKKAMQKILDNNKKASKLQAENRDLIYNKTSYGDFYKKRYIDNDNTAHQKNEHPETELNKIDRKKYEQRRKEVYELKADSIETSRILDKYFERQENKNKKNPYLKAYQDYLKEHPDSKITFEKFKKNII